MTLFRTFAAFMRLWKLQSVIHKKLRSTSFRLMVEQLAICRPCLLMI